MRTWTAVRDQVINSERFAELAMTGSLSEGIGAVMSAMDRADINYSESQIKKEVLLLRQPIEIPTRPGEQMEMF